jgi:precorrin-3B synthase
MQTGDGLLARLRPIGNAMQIQQLEALAAASSRYGNGIVEITARGSLQVRGLRPETVAPFESAVLEAGIRPEVGVSIETPPLAGLDPEELLDVRPLAESLRRRVAARQPAFDFAPKLAVTLDGGGRFHLGAVSADIKVTAFRMAGGLHFLLAVGGTAKTALPITICGLAEIEDAILAVLQALSSMGSKARGKDLDQRTLASLVGSDLTAPDITISPSPLLGIRSPSGDSDAVLLGMAFPYCQMDAVGLTAFAKAAEGAGAVEIRLAPDHGLYVTGLTQQSAVELQHAAAGLGFLTRPDDPRRALALCAGARGCASGHFDTHRLADLVLAEAPALLDGSFTLHLSGCPKGCAHPASSLVALAGAPSGYGLVVNGTASATPTAYLDDTGIKTALKRLAALVEEERQAGESAGNCLTRLGADRIGAALQLEKQ